MRFTNKKGLDIEFTNPEDAARFYMENLEESPLKIESSYNENKVFMDSLIDYGMPIW